MRSGDEIKALLDTARALGMPWIEVDGVKMPVPPLKTQAPSDSESPQINLDPCAEYTDEEILFWSTPRFLELHDERMAREQHAKDEAAFLRSTKEGDAE